MEPISEMECLLKVNIHCETCKLKVMQVLQSIRGVYGMTIDAETGTVRLSGEINPSTLPKLLAQYGKHAEISWVRLKGQRGHNYYYDYKDYYPYYSNQYYLQGTSPYGLIDQAPNPYQLPWYGSTAADRSLVPASSSYYPCMTDHYSRSTCSIM